MCNQNSDCRNFYICQNSVCVHKGLTPFEPAEIISYFLILVISAIGNVGGLGAGITKVPILVLIMNFSIQYSTYLSYPLILGACVSNIIALLFQKHPVKKQRPLIDFGLSIILVPAIIVGTSIGVIMNQLLPDLVLNLVLAIFLSSVSPYLYKKATNLSKQELQNKLKRKNQQLLEEEKTRNSELSTDNKVVDSENIEKTNLEKQYNINNDTDSQYNQADDRGSMVNQTQSKYEKLLSYFNDQDKKNIPLNKFLFLIGALVIATFFTFALRPNSFTNIKKCDSLYWFYFFLEIAIMIGISIFALQYLKNENQMKKMCKYSFDKNDLQINLKSYFQLSLAGLAAGLISGMTGLGAGFIVVPVLLYLNVQTRVAAATSGFMYFFISFTSILIVLIDKQLTWQIALFYMGLTLLGGFTLSRYLYYIVDKYRIQSLVIYIVLGIAIMNVVCTIFHIFQEADLNGWNYLFKMHHYCKS